LLQIAEFVIFLQFEKNDIADFFAIIEKEGSTLVAPQICEGTQKSEAKRKYF
jgi:hypothetical protein